MNFSFKKEERIYKRDDIALLFDKGNHFHIHPFKIIHYPIHSELEGSTLKFGISVPKKNFKKAVDRNLLKRRIREAYRLNRNNLKRSIGGQNKCLLIMAIYTHKTELDYPTIEDKIILSLRRLQGIYAEDH